MALPTTLWLVKAVQKEINAFLWNEKPAKIKYKTSISNFDNGGIKQILTALLKDKKQYGLKDC